ncbi:MAG TPA: energy transducer TonB [Chthoniobacterales bacterium]|nr:energy transducer TonB [Chthoniobacterales bacterium]
MRRIVLLSAALLLNGANLFAAEVEVKPPSSPKPKQSPKPQQLATPGPRATPTPQTTPGPKATPGPQASPAQQPTSPGELPLYRPALLGVGPASVINRIDTQDLIAKGQKDGSIMFCCSVKKTGEIANTWTYRGTPGSLLLEQELVRRLDTAGFVPGIYNRQAVHVLFFGTVTFKIVNGKPRLRIFANQEAEELKKESDFVGPQPFAGRDSKFEGLHYPNDALTNVLSGLVEMGMKIDANGNLKELKLLSEDPPLAGFGRAASEDFRVATFIPAFRDGKPVECSITLPVYYEP